MRMPHHSPALALPPRRRVGRQPELPEAREAMRRQREQFAHSSVTVAPTVPVDMPAVPIMPGPKQVEVRRGAGAGGDTGWGLLSVPETAQCPLPTLRKQQGFLPSPTP